MKARGVHRINVVDEATQFQFAGRVERISERCLLPVLQAFPFRIRGLRSDNASEWINCQVSPPLQLAQAEMSTTPQPTH